MHTAVLAVLATVAAGTMHGIIAVDSVEGSREKQIRFKVPKTEVLRTIELLHSFRKGKGKIGSETPHLIADAIELGRSLQ